MAKERLKSPSRRRKSDGISQHLRASGDSSNLKIELEALIPERFGIFPEFGEENPRIRGGCYLCRSLSKSSIDVAEALHRVYLDIV